MNKFIFWFFAIVIIYGTFGKPIVDGIVNFLFAQPVYCIPVALLIALFFMMKEQINHAKY